MRRINESHAIWFIIAAIVGIDVAWAGSIGMKIAFNPVAAVGLTLGGGLGFVYSSMRPKRHLAALCITCAQFVAFTAAVAVLVYLSVTSKFPLVDRYLAAGDSMIGFNWLSSFNWIQNHPTIDFVLNLAYSSIVPQACIVPILLSVTGRIDRMREFLWLFVLTLMVIVPLAWIFPAESAWAYFGVVDRVDAYHLADFTALRAGRLPEIPWHVNGLITFPSFHAALALILIYATRGIRVLFPLSIVLNALMIASTPSQGGHYLVDVLAGLATVPLAVAILRSCRATALPTNHAETAAAWRPDGDTTVVTKIEAVGRSQG